MAEVGAAHELGEELVEGEAALVLVAVAGGACGGRGRQGAAGIGGAAVGPAWNERRRLGRRRELAGGGAPHPGTCAGRRGRS